MPPLPDPRSPLPGSRPLASVVDLPEPARTRAAYALRELLRPLGLHPDLRDPAAWDGPGVYVGTQPHTRSPEALRLGVLPQALKRLDTPGPFVPPTLQSPAGRAVLFPASGDLAPHGDLVVEAFAWLSGWFEAQTTARDAHGRFPYAESLQDRLGTSLDPAVDALRDVLAAALQDRGVPVRRRRWGGAPWALALTCDLDGLKKPRAGNALRSLKALATGRPGTARHFGAQALARDPWRRGIGWMQAQVETLGRGTFFAKAGGHAREDNPIHPARASYRRVLQGLAEAGHEVGLHPSYFAHDHPGRLAAERTALKAALGAAPRAVRQHYLRWTPATARLQEAAGFRLDATLGFAEHQGFRRGTALPAGAYDLDGDRVLDLWQVPLAVMDGALLDARALGPDEALKAALDTLDVARRAGGIGVVLWHNQAFGERERPGHRDAFERLVGALQGTDAAVLPLSDALAAWARP